MEQGQPAWAEGAVDAATDRAIRPEHENALGVTRLIHRAC